MRKTLFIVNPEAGKKEGKHLKSKIEKLWTQGKIGYEIYITQDHADISAGVEKAKAESFTEIIVVGGDGTLLAVVNALGDHAIPIGVIPCGTGNDFVRSQSIDLDINQALMIALTSDAVKDVDIGRCNSTGFLNIASVGIDAAIVKRTQSVKKWIKSPLAYLIASIIEIITYEPIQITLTIDGQVYHRRIELVAISNGRYYGGGMKIAPMANPSDGFYDLIVINKMKKRRLLWLLPRLYEGTHITEPEVEIFKGQNIQIASEAELNINMDGELTRGKLMNIEKPVRKIYIMSNNDINPL